MNFISSVNLVGGARKKLSDFIDATGAGLQHEILIDLDSHFLPQKTTDDAKNDPTTSSATHGKHTILACKSIKIERVPVFLEYRQSGLVLKHNIWTQIIIFQMSKKNIFCFSLTLEFGVSIDFTGSNEM